jgi:hypothetical protein
MADAVSIAGLTLAVIESLIKLGERTGELISDIKAFDNVSQPQEDGWMRSVFSLTLSSTGLGRAAQSGPRRESTDEAAEKAFIFRVLGLFS